MQNDLLEKIEKLKKEETKIIYIKKAGTLFPTLEIEGSALSLESMFAALTCHIGKELGKDCIIQAFQRGLEYLENNNSDVPC